MGTFKLTGILLGNENEGFTAYFRQFPNVAAEGPSAEVAQQNLIQSLASMFEFLEEEDVFPSEENGYETFSTKFEVA
jgi:predicted RNase H-like HicB family nuclease